MKKIVFGIVFFAAGLVVAQSAVKPSGVVSGDEVAGWCDPTVVKSLDADADKVYGSEGYILFGTGTKPTVVGLQNQPIAEQGGTRVKLSENIRNMVFDKNPYTRINNGLYPEISVPGGERAGSGNTAVQVKAGLGGGLYYGNVLNFTLKTGKYRVGFITDMDGAKGMYSPKWVNLYTVGIGSVRSGLMTPDGVADMAFFDVTVTEPERLFTLALIHDKPLIGTVTAITFDRVK